IDRGLHRAPGTVAALAGDAHAGLAFLADHLSRALELTAQVLVAAHQLVEGIGYFSGEPGLVGGEAHAEIAVAHRLQRAQQFLEIEVSCRRLPVPTAVGGLEFGDRRRAAARRGATTS